MKSQNSLAIIMAIFFVSFSAAQEQEPLTDTYRISQTGNRITCTMPELYGWNNSGFATQNLINGDGAIQWKAGQINKHLIVGLSSSKRRNHYADVNYGIMNTFQGKVQVIENATNKFELDSYSTTDLFSIKREGTTIKYQVNGSTFYESLIPSNGDLIGDGVFFHINGFITDLKIVNGDSDTSGGDDTEGDGDNDSGGSGDTTEGGTTGGGVWTASGSNIYFDGGNVGIGTTAPGTYKLAVNGKIHTREVRVDQASWPDYVFQKEYQLPTLEEVEQHIKEKGHLINIPSAKEVKANGIELGEMNKLLLEKIEELTLYIIDQQKVMNNQQKMMKSQEKRIQKLENK